MPRGRPAKYAGDERERSRQRSAAYRRRHPERHRELQRRWAEANRESKRKATAARRARIRAVVLAAKNRPCADCGEQHEPMAMHFDHRDGEVKRFKLARAASHSLADVLAEIAKCEVRCFGCHMARHGLGGVGNHDEKHL